MMTSNFMWMMCALMAFGVCSLQAKTSREACIPKNPEAAKANSHEMHSAQLGTETRNSTRVVIQNLPKNFNPI